MNRKIIIFAAILLSHSAQAHETAIRSLQLPVRIACPTVLEYAVSAELQTLKLETTRSSISSAEVANPPENLFRNPRGTMGEYEPGPGTLEIRRGEPYVVFAYVNCDGQGSYSFKLSELAKPLVSGHHAQVQGRAEAELRSDRQRLDVLCKAYYAR